jgi:hypothetical protein
MRTFWKFAITGVIAGLLFGWLLSLVSGDVFVVFFVGILGLLVGIILGLANWNAPRVKS